MHTKEKVMALSILSVLALLAIAGPAFAAKPTATIPSPSPPAGSTQVLNLNYHVINDEDSGFHGYWALDHYAKNVQVWQTGTIWQFTLNVPWTLSVDLGTYLHTMTITTQSSSSPVSFSGTAVYPAGPIYETITSGTISGNTISWTGTYFNDPGYTSPTGYTYTAVGTIAADGSISGDLSSQPGNPWTAPAGTVTSTNTYYAFITYDGGYHTFAGALSPMAGKTETRDVAGNFNGFLEFTFTATANTPFSGNIPTKDYGGTVSDILLGTYGSGQTGPTSVFSWTNTYFTNFGNEVETNWGFYYYMGNGLGWTNAASGSSGDILA